MFRSYIIKCNTYTIICTFIIFLTIFCIQSFIEHFFSTKIQNLWKNSYIAILFSNCIFLERIKFNCTRCSFLHSIIDNFCFGLRSLIIFLFIGIFRGILERGNIFVDIKNFFGKTTYECIQNLLENSHLTIISARSSIPITFILLGCFFSVKKIFIKSNNKKRDNNL